jgi:hypothetical protein
VLTEHERERHRKARGVRGGRELLGAGLAVGTLGARRPGHLETVERATLDRSVPCPAARAPSHTVSARRVAIGIMSSLRDDEDPQLYTV